MARTDRDEARNLRRFRRLTRLASDVSAAQRLDNARQRLELQLQVDSLRYRALSSGSQWRAA